jgi:hypothetical protein
MTKVSSLTTEAAIARITEKFKSIRRNKDGAINGCAVHGYYASLKSTMEANGMAHNEACRTAWAIIKEIERRAA